MSGNSVRNEWMDRLIYNLKVLKDVAPRGMEKLVLHDAAETLEYLCKTLDEKNGINAPTNPNTTEEVKK